MRILFYSLISSLIVLFALSATAQSKKCTLKVTNDATIHHAWCWSFNTIKSNMKDIAAAGDT